MVVDAVASCSEPDAPSCATRSGAFEDEYDFDRCKRDMRSYRSEVEDFLDCVRRDREELKRQGDEAASEYNDAVNSFNRRARSD